MPVAYVVSYAPLVSSKTGRDASEQHSIPPFVDGSIRREPDLEHRYPAISCLCRTDKFAPRLRVGDYVAYLTQKRRYRSAKPHSRLTAILRVWKIFSSHAAAARWYRDKGLPLPSNCWVRGNRAKPFDESHRRFAARGCAGVKETFEAWDEEYRDRAKNYGTFVVCRRVFRDLWWNAPIVDTNHLIRAFGKKPGTQNPGTRPIAELQRLIELLGLNVRLPA